LESEEDEQAPDADSSDGGGEGDEERRPKQNPMKKDKKVKLGREKEDINKAKKSGTKKDGPRLFAINDGEVGCGEGRGVTYCVVARTSMLLVATFLALC